MIFYQLFESESSTYTYLLADERTKEALLIDPVIETVERDIKLLTELDLQLLWTVDTHVHADHITAASTLRSRLGAKTCVSKHANVACADRLLSEGDLISFGSYSLKAIETPGHTNSCMSFILDNKIFTGDVLFIRGCGRTDFQQGSSEKMYRSIHDKIFSLPDDTIIYPGHDYKGMTHSTVGLEKKFNPRLGGNKTLSEFSQIMAGLNLAPPKKIQESVPANLLCGEKPV